MKATATFEKKNNPKKDNKQSNDKFPFFGKKAKKKDDDCGCDKKKKDHKCKDCKDDKAPVKGKKKDTKKKDSKVNENGGIMSFKQFLNESDSFQDQYSPDNFENEEEEDEDAPIIPLEGSDVETHEEDEFGGNEHEHGFDEDEEDDWSADFEGDLEGDEDTEVEPEVASSRGTSKVEKINNELMSVNNEIGRLLDQYKSDHDIQSYKKNASPLLAKRKELQSKLDSAFDLGTDEDSEFADAGMDDETFTF